MRAKSIIFFTLLAGLSLAIVGGEDGCQERNFEDTGDSAAPTSCPSCSGNLWTKFYSTVGVMSGSYLLSQLETLVREHPMKSMAFAIIVGIITNENKKNIIEGIKKLRNSAYRVIGLGLKTNEESKKDEQKKEIKFVESVS